MMKFIAKHPFFEHSSLLFYLDDVLSLLANTPTQAETCTLTLKPTVSSCYQNSGSKATVTSFATSTCKVEKMGIVLLTACALTACGTGQTGGGDIWNDFSGGDIKHLY